MQCLVPVILVLQLWLMNCKVFYFESEFLFHEGLNIQAEFCVDRMLC